MTSLRHAAANPISNLASQLNAEALSVAEEISGYLQVSGHMLIRRGDSSDSNLGIAALANDLYCSPRFARIASVLKTLVVHGELLPAVDEFLLALVAIAESQSALMSLEILQWFPVSMRNCPADTVIVGLGNQTFRPWSNVSYAALASRINDSSEVRVIQVDLVQLGKLTKTDCTRGWVCTIR